MTNLKKSLVFLITLGTMQQIVPMLGTTTDSKPPMPTPNIRIVGFKPNESGLYDSNQKTALLFDEASKTVTTYTDIVPVSKAILHKLPKGAVAFATMPNPHFSGKQRAGGQTKNITLYGVPSDMTSHKKTTHSKSMLGAHGRGVFRGITIYGLGADQKGLYDRKTRMANINGTHYIVTTEYTPLHAATTPLQVPGSTLFAYINDTPAAKQKAGGANTKTYLYGVSTTSDVVA